MGGTTGIFDRYDPGENPEAEQVNNINPRYGLARGGT
jgi:hypothetical protein